MRMQCPECKTVTGGNAGFCGSCGYRFKSSDAKRAGATRSLKDYSASILAGLMIAVVRYMLQS